MNEPTVDLTIKPRKTWRVFFDFPQYNGNDTHFGECFDEHMYHDDMLPGAWHEYLSNTGFRQYFGEWEMEDYDDGYLMVEFNPNTPEAVIHSMCNDLKAVAEKVIQGVYENYREQKREMAEDEEFRRGQKVQSPPSNHWDTRPQHNPTPKPAPKPEPQVAGCWDSGQSDSWDTKKEPVLREAKPVNPHEGECWGSGKEITSEVCPDCGQEYGYCVCETCPECGELTDGGVCPECDVKCDKCGHYIVDGECNCPEDGHTDPQPQENWNIWNRL